MKKPFSEVTISSRTFLNRPKTILLSLAVLAATSNGFSAPFVEVSSFDVTANEKAGTVTLKWTTGAEVNNYAFYVKRSQDQVDWQTLHTITSQGDTHDAMDYDYVDNSPVQGTSYYMLEWRSNDGVVNSSTLQVTYGEPSIPNDDATLTEDATVLGFKASYLPQTHKVLMKWATAIEDENDMFIIKRAEEAGAWVLVAEITGAVNSTEALAYSYLDKNPIPGKINYRLEWLHQGSTIHVEAEVEVGLPPASKSNAAHVSLEAFQGRYDKYSDRVDLAWRTSVEIDNERFIVFRSKDQQNWVEVGREMGAGNSNAMVNYSMVDDIYDTPNSYYKLEWREGADMVYALVQVEIDKGTTDDDNSTSTRSATVDQLSASPINNMGDMIVNWNTGQESDNAYFILFRSRDMINWQRIASIPGAGNSTKEIDYSHEDENLDPGPVHYKLAWYDNFGNVAEQVTSAEVPSGAAAYRSVPNPTMDRVLLSSDQAIDHVGRIRVISPDGHRYQVPTTTKNGELDVDLSSLPKGLYIIQLEDGFVRVQKN